MIEAILFDIGNVLVRFDYDKAVRGLGRDSDATLPEIREALERYHADHETGRISSVEYAQKVCEKISYKGSQVAFREVYSDIFTVNKPMWDFVAALPSGIRRLLFSNTSEIHQNWLFSWYPSFAEFHGGVYSWSALGMKPDEPIYHRALEMLSLPPEKVAYIDDLPANIETGRRLGLRAIAYHPDRHEEFLKDTSALEWAR